MEKVSPAVTQNGNAYSSMLDAMACVWSIRPKRASNRSVNTFFITCDFKMCKHVHVQIDATQSSCNGKEKRKEKEMKKKMSSENEDIVRLKYFELPYWSQRNRPTAKFSNHFECSYKECRRCPSKRNHSRRIDHRATSTDPSNHCGVFFIFVRA